MVRVPSYRGARLTAIRRRIRSSFIPTQLERRGSGRAFRLGAHRLAIVGVDVLHPAKIAAASVLIA